MVEFTRYVLANGLRLLIHRDKTTPIAAVNILYDVGARDEHPDHTGFAHLFEHLMFEGSANVPDFDDALQLAGGENNAFTNNDITNYYLTLPKQNLETALWLESDRMMELAFSEEKLRIQKNVVVEEFRQTHLNQPYGDIWLLLRPLIYKTHPYQWSTIGKNIEHVQNATLHQVKEFFYRYYRPNRAVIVISGDLEPENVREMVEKWFGDIPAGIPLERNLPAETLQNESRKLVVERDVPFDEIYLAFHTGTRLDENFYATDLLTDLLAGGQSGRLRERLVKKRKIFAEANAWISGSLDLGFLALSGKLMKGQTLETAREALLEELDELCCHQAHDYEMQKVKNKSEAASIYSETGILSKSMNLAYYELLGDANILNHHNRLYSSVTAEDVLQTARQIFKPEKLSELHYLARK
jgi:zinc protease